MNYIKTWIVVMSLILSTVSTSAFGQKYFTQYSALATELSAQYGIPKEVILGVGYMESGGGNSKLARLANNHFGITGKNTVYNSRYRSFKSVEEGFHAFCQLLTRKKFYSRLKGTRNLNSWIASIAAAGYSTTPSVWISNMKSALSKL